MKPSIAELIEEFENSNPPTKSVQDYYVALVRWARQLYGYESAINKLPAAEAAIRVENFNLFVASALQRAFMRVNELKASVGWDYTEWVKVLTVFFGTRERKVHARWIEIRNLERLYVMS